MTRAQKNASSCRRMALVATGLLLACSPSAPAKYPDQAAVTDANGTWCAMLAKLDGSQLAEWRYGEACVAATPSASSAFLKRLSSCYGGTMEEYGDSAPDSGAIIGKCSVDILGGADPGDVGQTALYQARCSRQERCQKVSAAICDGAWGRLDGMTQALLSSKYNLQAQSRIAACLDDEDCAENDAPVEAACYDAAHKQLVWLPLSLAHDASVGPKTD